MTTARLGNHHILQLRDLAFQEGDHELARTCDVAMSSLPPPREVRAARKQCVDAINARTGYDRLAEARKAKALSKTEIAEDLRKFLANPGNYRR